MQKEAVYCITMKKCVHERESERLREREREREKGEQDEK